MSPKRKQRKKESTPRPFREDVGVFRPLPDKNKAHVTFYCDASLVAAMNKAARDKDITRSELIRKLLTMRTKPTEALTFARLQREQAEWSEMNFGVRPSWHPLLGAVEELGELCHAHLKNEQGIRGGSEKHQAAKIDAVADTIIYLTDYCNKEGIDLQHAIEVTWNQVQQRDWKKNPETGGE